MCSMDVRRLHELAREDPGSNEAVDLLVAIRRAGAGGDLTGPEARIVDAWARRLHSGVSYQGRMNRELREERLNSVRAWVCQMLEEWRPNENGVTGSPAAYLNSRRSRLTRLLPIETGTPADTDEKARRVLAAAKAEQSEGGDPEDLEDLRRRTERRLLNQQLAKLEESGQEPTEERARENMRKRGDLKWLERLDELVVDAPLYGDIPDRASGLYGKAGSRIGTLLDLLTGDLSGRQQQSMLCAPHLQYLLATEDTTLL